MVKDKIEFAWGQERMKVIAVLCLLGACGAAQAKWVEYSRSDNYGIYYYDDSTIKQTSTGLRTVLTKRVNSSATELIHRDGFDEIPPLGIGNFSHELQKLIVNCDPPQIAVASHSDYSKDGSIIRSIKTEPSEMKFLDIMPGTARNRLVRLVCAKK